MSVKQIFILIIALFLSGCVETNKQPVLLETNCVLPCWNGIVPGETSKQDVLRILSTVNNVKKNTILEETFQGMYGEMVRFYISTDSFLFSPSVEISFRNNRAGSIFFFGDLNLTFGDLIELTGDPNWVVRWHDRRGEQLRVINTNQGIAFGMTSDDIGLTAETSVTVVELFAPDEFQTLVDNQQMLPYFSFDEMMKSVIPWQGYGNLDEKYPMLFPSTK